MIVHKEYFRTEIAIHDENYTFNFRVELCEFISECLVEVIKCHISKTDDTFHLNSKRSNCIEQEKLVISITVAAKLSQIQKRAIHERIVIIFENYVKVGHLHLKPK